MAELSVAERNLLGQGQYGKVSVQYGQYARGFELSFAEPYFLGNVSAVGVDLYYKQTLATNYVSYNSETAWPGNARRICAERRALVPGSLQHLSAENHAAICVQQLSVLGNATINAVRLTVANGGPGVGTRRWRLLRRRRVVAGRAQGAGSRRGAGVDAWLYARLQHPR